MNIEAYGYVILTVIIGMAIVFVFLTVLSLLMTAIRALFRDQEKAPVASGGNAQEDVAPGGPPLQYRGNRWLIATVAAYLDLEELDARSNPAPWVTDRSPATDPWLTAPRRET